jgi:energy-coupling factor transporter ATP-binding protein EcfA2
LQIISAQIHNFKSLKKVSLENLGGLTVLIGANGSGKSNILEALFRFFAEIDLTGVPAGLDGFTWFDGDTDLTVIIELEIQLSKAEWTQMVPAIAEFLTSDKPDTTQPSLRIRRTISKAPTGWQTTDIWAGTFKLLAKGKVADKREIMRALGRPKIALVQYAALAPQVEIAATAAAASAPSEAAKSGSQPASEPPRHVTLVVDNIGKKVYRSSAFATQLVPQGLATAADTASANTDAGTATKQLKADGYEILDKDFAEADFNAMFSLTPEKCQEMLPSVYAFLKNKMKLVLPVRDTWPQNPLARVPLLDQETHTQLKTLSTSEIRADQKRWNEIRQLFSEASRSPLETHPNYLCVNDIDFRIPIQYLGGGHQEYLILLRHLTDDIPMLAIEEAEIHLHPSLMRILFDIFKRYSAKKEIILTTHSTVFLDHADLSTTWIVTRKNKISSATRVTAPEDLRSLLYQLGSKPSDLFFANALLFVEGDSDKEFLQRAAELLGLNFLANAIYTIPVHGKDNGAYYLDVWVGAVKAAQAQAFMLFDKGAGPSCKQHIQSGFLTLNKNLFFLKKGAIEDYYPLEAVVDVLSSVFKVGTKDEIRPRIPAQERVEAINTLLKEKKYDRRGWKLLLAVEVARRLEVGDIGEEVVGILERIRTEVSYLFADYAAPEMMS